jgi:hypothetical protein
MRIALIFWGLARSLRFTIKTIQENIFSELIKNNIKYDIYFHTYKIDTVYNNKRANEINIKLDENEYKILNADYLAIDDKNEVVNEINLKKYEKHGFHYSWILETFHNYILAMYSKMKAYMMMKNSNIKYDYVVYLRPDVEYCNSFPVKQMLELGDNQILMPAFQTMSNINDRFAITTDKYSGIYGLTFENLGTDSQYMQIHSEIYLYTILCIKNKMQIVYLENFVFKRVRANGLVCSLDKNLHNQFFNIDKKSKRNIMLKNTCIYVVLLCSEYNGNLDDIFIFTSNIIYINVDIYVFTDNINIQEYCKKYYIECIFLSDINSTNSCQVKNIIILNPFKYFERRYQYAIYITDYIDNVYYNYLLSLLVNFDNYYYIINKSYDNINLNNIKLFVINYEKANNLCIMCENMIVNNTFNINIIDFFISNNISFKLIEQNQISLHQKKK